MSYLFRSQNSLAAQSRPDLVDLRNFLNKYHTARLRLWACPLFIILYSINTSKVSRNNEHAVGGPKGVWQDFKCIKFFVKDSCSGHLTFFCLTRISSMCMRANKIDCFITIFSLWLIRILGSRCLHDVLLLILNSLIERSEQIIEKAHKVNYSGSLNKNAFNCSVQLLWAWNIMNGSDFLLTVNKSVNTGQNC